MTLNRENYIDSIVTMLNGFSFGDQLAILAATISFFAVHNQRNNALGDERNTTPDHRKVPKKCREYSRFGAVWDYMEKLDGFDTIEGLRRELATHFGEENTPSVSHLHRYLKANKSVGLERKPGPFSGHR